MANISPLGAALSSLGESIPQITSGAIRSIKAEKKEKKKEEEDKLRRQLLMQKIEGGELSLEEVRRKSDAKKRADEAIESLGAAFGTEEKRKKLKKDVMQGIERLTAKDLRMVGGKEGAEELFADQAPTGKTRDEMVKESGLERYQYVSPEAQGILTGTRQREKRAEKLADTATATKARITAADTAFERQKEIRGLGLEADKAKREAEAELRSPEVERREATAIHKQLESYRKNTKTSRDKIQTIGSIDELIPGGIFGERKDAEGKVPVIGVGIKPFRKWLLDDASTDMRVYINQLFNTNIKEQSGAAVTAAEFKRMEEVMGLGTRSTVNQFKTYMKAASIKAYRKLDEAEKTLVGPSRDAARERYLTAREIPFLPDKYKTSKPSGEPVTRDFGEEYSF